MLCYNPNAVEENHTLSLHHYNLRNLYLWVVLDTISEQHSYVLIWTPRNNLLWSFKTCVLPQLLTAMKSTERANSSCLGTKENKCHVWTRESRSSRLSHRQRVSYYLPSLPTTVWLSFIYSLLNVEHKYSWGDTEVRSFVGSKEVDLLMLVRSQWLLTIQFLEEMCFKQPIINRFP